MAKGKSNDTVAHTKASKGTAVKAGSSKVRSSVSRSPKGVRGAGKAERATAKPVRSAKDTRLTAKRAVAKTAPKAPKPEREVIYRKEVDIDNAVVSIAFTFGLIAGIIIALAIWG